ncbi:tyrosine-type recombinase/integrase [Neobacillus ginsengisoli]|uniref:Integrase/recombinase XerD n=1 Tax=Neobacillus ginsengisoli TaxID=904295 RepID=A0ABT9XRB2_9BACI|nr:tyrosine-type recombinase/integrase [Neobacillus ginsengisoli]MDQ0197938.1 integrase/recombinase XerD [Neobacillus ginsengisoli]
MKLNDLLDEYVLECQIKNQSKLTITNVKISLSNFVKSLDDVGTVENIKGVHIKQWILKRQGEGIQANTINTGLKHIRAMFNYACEEEIIDRNPMERIKLLKQTKRVIKTYSNDDVKLILNSFNGKTFFNVRDKTIIVMLLETGIRRNELRSIKLDDIYEDSIRIRGKGDKQRFIPISLPLRKQMIRYQRARMAYIGDAECECYFISMTRKQLVLGSINHIIRKLEDLNLSVKPTIHSFRRFYASRMLENIDLLFLVSAPGT